MSLCREFQTIYISRNKLKGTSEISRIPFFKKWVLLSVCRRLTCQSCTLIFSLKKKHKKPQNKHFILSPFFYVSGVETVIKGGGEEDAKAKISSQWRALCLFFSLSLFFLTCWFSRNSQPRPDMGPIVSNDYLQSYLSLQSLSSFLGILP